MLFLSKILQSFFLPLGVTVLLLAYALLRKRHWPVVVGLVVLYFSSIPFVGDWLIGGLESRYPAVAIAQVEPADAVVVLGGIFGPPVAEGMVPNLSESVERLEAGILLTQAGKAPWLVFTGARIPWKGRTRFEGEDSKIQAMRRGIPAAQILITREVGNTADEARAVAAMIPSHHWHRIILVTTGWHMPRAAQLFGNAGVNFIPFPVDFRRDTVRPLTLLDFAPCADGMHNTETALREWYGRAFYALTSPWRGKREGL
ncbi:MAG TPA: YdcF family protein [Lacunisphaera sp.]|jgi:uncharacterized SAM-binding protein YcdF (DUF218 family)